LSAILLGVGASAAIHKSCDLASKLAQQGHKVRAVLTPKAARLVAPQLFEALTGEPAASSEWGPRRRGAMDHIELASWAELLVVAPCSADLVARLALGLGGTLLGTVALALPADRPRVLCPAMNPHMLQNPALRRHLEQLRADGWRVLEPGEGHMACGVAGRGRLVEPSEILSELQAILRA
jgi:phosphopantothenoylcysteine decarboxylase/phosphopantothenate--cysteine ligase